VGMAVLEMATGKPAWPNPSVATFKICATEEMPPIPDSLSKAAHDFLELVRRGALTCVLRVILFVGCGFHVRFRCVYGVLRDLCALPLRCCLLFAGGGGACVVNHVCKHPPHPKLRALRRLSLPLPLPLLLLLLLLSFWLVGSAFNGTPGFGRMRPNC
jgi:hypothetical protein